MFSFIFECLVSSGMMVFMFSLVVFCMIRFIFLLCVIVWVSISCRGDLLFIVVCLLIVMLIWCLFVFVMVVV